MPTALSLDFETRSTTELTRVGVSRYVEDPETDVLCASFALDDGPIATWKRGEPVPEAIRAIAADQGYIRAWNAGFERAIWNAVMVPKYGWPTIPDDRWICTASLAARCALPRSLEKAAEALGLSVAKDQIGHRLMMRMCKPQRDGSWLEDDVSLRRLVEYCVQDVEVERAVYHNLPNVSDAVERQIWLLDQTINRRGVAVDMDFVRASHAIVTEETVLLNRELSAVTEGTVRTVSQNGRLRQWLASLGVDTASVDKYHTRDLLRTELDPKARRVLEIRALGAKSSTAKLAQLITSVCQDLRVRDILLYFGANTGRWAGRGVQPQNFPRPYKGVEKLYDAIRTGLRDLVDMVADRPVMEVMSAALRGCFVAKPGTRFIAADYNAIEARVLAWLAGAEKLLAAFRQPKNLVYAEMGGLIFNKTAEEVQQADDDGSCPLWRWVGKNTILGCGYQIGPKKYREQVRKQGDIDLPAETCELAIQLYRATHWEIPVLWKDMNTVALRVVADREREWREVEWTGGLIHMRMEGEWLVMLLPSGRKLWYCRPRVEEREAPWSTPEEPAFVEGVVFEGVNPITKKWGDRHLYGGLLTENAVQAISRDLMANAMLHLEPKGYPVVLTVHDEILCEVPNGHGSLDEFTQIMTDLPEWAADCPIAAAGWEGERWRK